MKLLKHMNMKKIGIEIETHENSAIFCSYILENQLNGLSSQPVPREPVSNTSVLWNHVVPKIIQLLYRMFCPIAQHIR